MEKKKKVKIILVSAVILLLILFLLFCYFLPNRQFKKNEKIFFQAGKRYFEINQSKLPKEEGRVLSVSMETLLKQKYLSEELFLPYSKKSCDIKNSTVRAKNTKNGKKYYTYLKCQSFESKIDHIGPKITLKGEENLVVDKGSNYQDAGIESIVDNVDGNINIDTVIINGSVDTSKIGTYTISYTAKDSLDNKETVKRTIEVVELLSDTIKKDTEKTNGIYKGENTKYVLFNHMLFQIVRVNSNGSVLIASKDPLANVDYGSKDGRFANSSMDHWLNNYFYNLLEKDYQNMILSNKWCDDVLTNDTVLTQTECNRYSEKRKIGLLSFEDYNNSLENELTYLNLSNIMWYSNFTQDKQAWSLTTLQPYPEELKSYNTDTLFNVRPAILLKNDVKILDGIGTEVSPFILKESKVRRGDKLNTRQIGEYIRYSGYLFRINGTREDGLTPAIMESVLAADEIPIETGYSNPQKSNIYNPDQKDNIGYKINNELSSSIDTTYLERTEVEVPIYQKKITYEGKHQTKKYTVRLSAPSAFELFSAKGRNSGDEGYWLIDSSKDNAYKTFVFEAGTIPFEDVGASYMQKGVKLKVYFKKNLTIKDGNGTEDRPFILTDKGSD